MLCGMTKGPPSRVVAQTRSAPVYRLCCDGCGRTLDEMTVLSGTPVYRGDPLDGARHKPGSRFYHDRQHVRRYSDTSDGRGPGELMVYECHRRCGQRFTKRHDRLSAAVLAAHEAGRKRVYLGTDV